MSLDHNRDLLVAGAAAIAMHAAAYVAICSAAALPRLSPNRRAAADVMAVVLVAAPQEESDAPVPPAPLRAVPAPDPKPVPSRDPPVAIDDREAEPPAPGPLAPMGWAQRSALLRLAAAGRRSQLSLERFWLAAPAVAGAPDERKLKTPAAAPPPGSAPSPAEPTHEPTHEPRPDPGPESIGPAPIIAPESIRNEPPRYPKVAQRRGYEGTVDLRVHVLASGRSDAVQIERSSGYATLDRAAVRAAKRWRFKPATRAGWPIEIWIEIPVRFELRDEPSGDGGR